MAWRAAAIHSVLFFYCFVGLALAFVIATPPSPLFAQEVVASSNVKRHAMSLIREPKYPPDFKHFSYVNPDAPKGGLVRLSAPNTFDNLNRITYKGVRAAGLLLVYESLMYDSSDEPSTSYGLIAEWVTYPDDYSSVTFKLRNEARWHDGKPITAEDVIFSLDMAKKANPLWAAYYKNVVKSEITGEREVTFSFDTKNNRELPMIMGQLLVLPKHYWTAKDGKGELRDITKTTMEPPLGSGPYKIKSVTAGRNIVYERVPDYWGKDLAVNQGRNNFDTIRFDYFRDNFVAFEAFKKGDIDFYAENSSKNWATGYKFDAVTKGFVRRQEVALKTSHPMQAFVVNIRREKFSDPRVRSALNYAFNFEWANENLFYGQYERVASYFQNTELASRGLPEGQELDILNEVKDFVPGDVFTAEYKNPMSKTRGEFRENLKQARSLLKDAGWNVVREVKEDDKNCGTWCRLMISIGLRSRKTEPVLRNGKGDQMEIEFLIVSPTFERVIQPYLRNLERLGIKGTIRLVDSTQYSRRVDNFDFDMVVGSFAQSHSPGNEQRYFWGSAAADKPGSRNLIGIKDKAIDKLIDKVIFAKDRDELVAASRALDRVLLWNHFVVPQWFAPRERIAFWTKFGQPQKLPGLSVGFPDVWWYDTKAADKLKTARQ